MDTSVLAAALGDEPADVLLKHAQLVNVLTGEVYPADVALRGGRIAGIGAYKARRTVDLRGRFLCPGFLDAHVHLESSMVIPAELARAVVPRGTTGVFADPHEIANVLGEAGVRFMLDASEGLPLRVWIMAPSCVPATRMETSGAVLGAPAIRRLLKHPRVLGLAEMMNFPGVIHRDPGVMGKLDAAAGRPIDGHAPGLSGRGLCAYVAAGIGSDHECTTAAEAREKLRLGMHIMIREGTAARNLSALLPLVTPVTSRHFSLCTDDRHPADLLGEGHIDSLLAACVARGLNPVTAVQLATINTARYFGLRDRGAVAPGYHADLVVVDDLETFRVRQVFVGGEAMLAGGRLAKAPKARPLPARVRASVRIPAGRALSFAPPRGAPGRVKVRVIDVVPGQILTGQSVEELDAPDGRPQPAPERDLLKIAVVERHRGTGRIGVGFVRGFGLRKGALASSVAHDSHNIVAIGTSDDELRDAVRAVARMKGGQAVTAAGRTLAALPLPVAGLMSDRPLQDVRRRIDALNRAARKLGCTLQDPLMTMSFLSLPVIPELKLTDRGLVDVGRFDFVALLA